VAKAAEAYLTSLEARNRRTAYDARLRFERLFLPQFGSMRLADLTRGKLEAWRDRLVRRSDDPEQRRRSQDTANRVLTIVKALLNHAMADSAHSLSDDGAWRLVRPFQRVARAREVHFTSEEVRRLLGAIPDQHFRDFVTAGFLTGARYGELAACQVRHFDRSAQALRIPSGKTGSRAVILQPEAVAFLTRVAEGRDSGSPLLPRPDGCA